MGTSLKRNNLDAESYWNERLTNFTLQAIGNIGLSLTFNRYLHKARKRTIERIRRKYNLTFSNKSVLDIGTGTGFWIDYYLRRGADKIVGVDISNVAISKLRQKYSDQPQVKLVKCNFASEHNARAWGSFDIVNIIDVAYLVIDDQKFGAFINNCCTTLTKGGIIFLSDYFRNTTRNYAHLKFRPLDIYETLLKHNGVRIIAITPMYVFLNKPSDPNNGAISRVFNLLFDKVTMPLTRSRCVHAYLKTLYTLDSSFSNFNSLGVSIKLLFGLKSSHNSTQERVKGFYPAE